MKQGKPLLYILAFVVFVMVCIGYWHHFNNPFHFDDEHTIVTNSYIRSLDSLPKFFTDARTSSSLPANQAYRPGVTTLDAIDYAVQDKFKQNAKADTSGFAAKFERTFSPAWAAKPQYVKDANINPLYFHLSIFTAFLLVGFFIYLFSIKIYNIAWPNPLNPYISLITTAVFMLHTANAETINYIISRSDTDSTLLIMIAMCVFAYTKPMQKYALYLIPMAIGFLVKEPAVMIGPLAFIYLFFFEEQYSLRKVFDIPAMFRLLVKVAPALLLAIILFAFAKHMTPPTWTSGGLSVKDYMLTETFVMVHYVNNFFFPFNLSADTDWGLIRNPFDDRVLIGVSFIIFTLYLAYKASLQAKSRPIAFGILWFYLALIPTSTVVPFSEVLNDHRVFFPYIGLTIAFVWSLFLFYNYTLSTLFASDKSNQPQQSASLRAYNSGVLLVLATFLVTHMFGIRERSKVWKTEDALWKDVSIKSPHNGRGLMNYGIVLMGRGDYKGALEYFNKAKAEWPYYSYLYVNLGVLQGAMGNPAEAEQNFKYALQLNAQNPNCYYYYALMLKNNKRVPEAKDMVNRGLALSPTHTDLTRLYNDLNTNPAYITDVKEKLDRMEKAAQQNPTAENYLNLSLEYYYNARYLDCVHAAEEALKVRPNYDLAYNNICSAYNMLHEWDKAIDAGQKAVAANPGSQLAKNNLQVSFDGKKSGK